VTCRGETILVGNKSIMCKSLLHTCGTLYMYHEIHVDSDETTYTYNNLHNKYSIE